jgi:hypothetical protein
MSHTNPSSPAYTRLIYFSTDGRSLINLPANEHETFSLIDNTSGDIRLLRFAPADAEQIATALHSGATFRFAGNTLHVAAASGRLEFIPLPSGSAADTTSALPSPRAIQRLHGDAAS